VAREKRADTGWVEPPRPIKGLDHLGVQAPCIALYTELLPGITNVTDRARYYSFHPWLLWSFDSRYKVNRSLDELKRVLRRAECLFTLVAIRHARNVADNDERRHGIAMVGRQQLLKVADQATVDLGVFATMEDVETRYLGNALGGLGQYYYGSLRDLKLIDQVEGAEPGYPGYGEKLGPWIAKAMDAGVDGDRFFKVLEQEQVTHQDLDDLSEFCPCQLVKSHAECEALRDLFLARSDELRADGEARRTALALLLDLSERVPGLSAGALQATFRSSCYTGYLPSDATGARAWTVSAQLEHARKRWGVYEQNDLFAVSLQGLFSAVLETIELTKSGYLPSVSSAGVIASALLASARPEFKRASFAEFLARTKAEIAIPESWEDPRHEEQIANEVVETRNPSERAARSVDLLAALLARGVPAEPYADFALGPDYFDLAEINLRSLARRVESEWANVPFEQWVHWLATRWGVGRHLRVALRKLRFQRQDTFRVRPLEDGFRVVESPPPGFTVPRLGPAVQILRDIGLIDDIGDGIELTEDGRTQLGDLRE